MISVSDQERIIGAVEGSTHSIMAKRCSHCNHDSHNSRTYPNRGVRLIGVCITNGYMRKSAITGNLAVLARLAAAGGGSPPTDLPDPFPACFRCSGYVSDSLHGRTGSRARMKGPFFFGFLSLLACLLSSMLGFLLMEYNRVVGAWGEWECVEW